MNREDYFTIEKENGIATVWLDAKKEKQNVISPDMIGFFDDVFKDLDKDPAVKAVVLISRKKDFIAGADIKAFKAEKPGDFAPISRAGHKSMELIEKSSKPIVSAIHGTCYGLGTEISLACHARVASDDPSTKLALPEVKLGLLPGGGGTQRLPRLVGIQAALDMMLTGKNIFAGKAKKIGLVDELTNKNKLHSVALQMAEKLVGGWKPPKKKKSFMNWFLDDTGIGRKIVFSQARKMSAKMTQGNYPAIPEIINCAEIGLTQGLKAGYEAEVQKFEGLMLGQVSKELRQLFFNMTDNKKNPYPDLAKKLDKFAILGAGFMGSGIAEVSIPKGMDVLLKDLSMDMILKAQKDIWKGLEKKVKRRAMSKPTAQETISRLVPRQSYEGFDTIDLVVEAIVENMEVKKKVIGELESVCHDNVIIASNTSSLPLTKMSEFSKRPENIIGMHYFSPVPKMPLLEIVVTEKTADWVIATCYDVGIRQGKTCIVVKDGPGFYVNRILAPYINENLLMIEEGAKLEDLDKALMKKGFPVGPIRLLDEVGLDIAAHIMGEGIAEFAGQREGFTISKGVLGMYEAGYLGKKNNKGFYHYDPKTKKRKGPDPSVYQYFKGAPRKSMDTEEMQNRGIMLMLNEAVFCLEEGIIASPTDGDLGAVFGIGFLPYTGGPFRYMDHLGLPKVKEIMDGLTQKFGPKFKPAKMIVDLAASGGSFHTQS